MSSSAQRGDDNPGRNILVRQMKLRCEGCNKLLAEDITPPFRIKCKCGVLNEVKADQALHLTISAKG